MGRHTSRQKALLFKKPAYAVLVFEKEETTSKVAVSKVQGDLKVGCDVSVDWNGVQTTGTLVGLANDIIEANDIEVRWISQVLPKKNKDSAVHEVCIIYHTSPTLGYRLSEK